MRRAAFIAVLILPAAPVAAGDLVLDLPIDCTIGETCYIQNLVDHDPGPGFVDYTCGTLGYDGHTGTDFALPTMADMRRGVDVLASASGVVQGWRDGVADVGITAQTAGKECGNGVVLRHDNGWETQYCHLKSGSVTVENGQRIERGDVLGQIGFSGLTEFPHVQLSLRKDGQKVDPFDASSITTCGDGGKSLWADPPDYTPGGVLDAGFYPGIPDYDLIKDGSAASAELAQDADALVLFGFAYSGRKGDLMNMRIIGPKGEFLSQSIKLDKDQAQFFRATGKRLTKARWPAGTYTGIVTLQRGAQTLGTQQVQMVIR